MIFHMERGESKKLAKADFYYGALSSQLTNNNFAPAIIEPGDSRCIYSIENDFKIYEKYGKGQLDHPPHQHHINQKIKNRRTF